MDGKVIDSADLSDRAKTAIFWRSGSQIVAQLILWTSTFFVIRTLSPSDYGLFAMTQVVVSLMNLMNGYSFTGALVQAETIDRQRVAQVLGLLIVMNGSLALIQFLLAPAAALYFHHPIVADMLRVQAILYLTTPFIVVPQALLARTIDFRTQARVNFGAALISAIVGPALAFSGFGVWTLVFAPLSLFVARAIGLQLVGRWWVTPSFRFRGAGKVFSFGLAVLVSELLWFVQTQADVFIGGRLLDAHALGIYTTALFLSQILVNKFVPALNEVAFPTYARMQKDRSAVQWAFLKAVRLVMVVAIPFSLGLSVTASPLVFTVLGPKWAEIVPVVQVLGLAMPFVTLQILYTPATNALGRPSVAARISATGAIIMPLAFLIGAHHGPSGMAMAWLLGFPLVALIATILSLRVIGVSASALFSTILPAGAAGLAMAGLVALIDSRLPSLQPLPHLIILTATGATLYFTVLFIIARPVLAELLAMIGVKRTARLAVSA